MSYKSLKKFEYIKHGSSASEYQKRFNSYDAHKIGLDIAGNPAFFVETMEIRQKVRDIHKMDKELIKLCKDLPEQALDLFSVRSIIDEIQITNDIEGVQSTKKEISDAYNNKGERFKGITEKYKMLKSGDLISLNTIEDVRALYDDLVLPEVLEESEDNMPDGDVFRKGKVHVRSSSIFPVHSGLYPEQKIKTAMTKAMRYLNNEKEELLYRIAVFHYLIGYIHPFYDGNGRLNRFISSYMLTKEFEPILSYRLSYSIKENQSAYNKAFNECNDGANFGELTMFVDMFLDILYESIENTTLALSKRKEQYVHYRGMISILPNGNIKKYADLYNNLILSEIFSIRGFSIKELSEELKCSHLTVRNMIKELKNLDLVKENSSGREYYYGINLDNLSKFS